LKKIFLIFSFIIAGLLSAQNPIKILQPDSAREIVKNINNTPEAKFYALRSLGRYFYTNGFFDSANTIQKEMFSLATYLNRDSLLVDAWVELGIRHSFRTDNNLGLASYLKSLDYKPTKWRKARSYNLIAYLFSSTNNDLLALNYLNKSDSVGSFPGTDFQKNIFYSVAYNNLMKPDSALFYLQKAESVKPLHPDPTIYAVLLRQFARSFELKNDFEQAESYFKKTFAYCIKENLVASQVRLAVNYCNFLITRDSFPAAHIIALENLKMARQYGFIEFIAETAEILKKIYSHYLKLDSAFYFSELQIKYSDSASNQKKIVEFQNLIFTQQLKDIEENAKAIQAKQLRKRNIQYALLAIGIITFILFSLLIMQRVIINVKIITFLSVIGLLVVFEFLNLLLHPFLESITHHNPILMLLSLVCIAALLVPLHHRLEKWATHRLVEKNRQIRLTAAKKTIEQLENK